MRKIILFSLIILLVLYLAVSNYLFVLNRNKEVSYTFKTIGKDIFIKDNKWNEFEMRGININSTMPGTFLATSVTSQQTFYEWLVLIDALGINTLRVEERMPATFYRALYKFNIGNDDPLYLLQSIPIDTVVLKDGVNPVSEDFKSEFKKNARTIVDVVHGKSFIASDDRLMERYDNDVSDYVIGYTVGIEWPKHDIVFADIYNSKLYYDGKYFTTNQEATVFESFLAEIADHLVDYEVRKYGQQKLINFISSERIPFNSIFSDNGDIVIGDEENDRIIKDYVTIENIIPTNGFKTGLFVSYNILSSPQGSVEDYEQFFRWLGAKHSIPVVVSQYGIPSARFVTEDFITDYAAPYVTETQQGGAIVTTYQAIINAGLAGSFILDWQDSWYQSVWNTVRTNILDRSAFWHDVQTQSQSFGLLAFEPGKSHETIYPDHSTDEWDNSDILLTKDNMSLAAKSDEKYLYLLVETDNSFNQEIDKIYIDLNVTPNSGAKEYHHLKFENDVDYIIEITNDLQSRILVHNYYDTYQFLEQEKELMRRPDLVLKNKHQPIFNEIYGYVKPNIYIDSSENVDEKYALETGILHFGNANPSAADYNSIADIFYGDQYIELRIPWALLNFMDPSTKQIQDDFYDSFQIEPRHIDGIDIGLTIIENDTEVTRIASVQYRWSNWLKPKYHQRLKQSYYIVQEFFTR